jgi:hypothetical protein
MAKAKVKVSPVLLAWSKCRMQAGVKPGKKMTGKQKKTVKSCVLQRIKK